MTNKELKEEITRLKTALAELEEKVAALPEKVDGVFKPEYGEDYWFFASECTVFVDRWGGDSIDQDRYAIGNCFPNKQAAEDAVRVLKLIQKARESQDGFVPDWEDTTQKKYYLYLCNGEDISIANYASLNQAPTLGYWEDKSVCEEFIDENHDELLWFFKEYQR